ncbi:MAG: FmdB family zinc ribbon protein [Thermoleophilia bacterium]
MPIYEYRCLKCGHQFEKMQKIADRPVSRCEKCNERVTRVFHPVAIHFKGSGFYSTDYGKKRSDSRQKSAEEPSKGGSKPAKKDKGKQSRKKAAAGSKEG